MENKTCPGSYYQSLFDPMNQEHNLTLLESQMANIIDVVRKMEPVRQGPVYVKDALQWSKETIEFANKEFECPQPLVETWGNLYMNVMHAIGEALQEYDNPTKNDSEKNLAFIAAVTEEGAEAWKMEYDACRSILTELVDLKNIKDLEGKTEDYHLRQPVAWIRAKRFLEKYQHINF